MPCGSLRPLHGEPLAISQHHALQLAALRAILFMVGVHGPSEDLEGQVESCWQVAIDAIGRSGARRADDVWSAFAACHPSEPEALEAEL